MSAWSNFFMGQLGAAAALAGLLFVSVSVNQARILALGRMADRGLEALIILLLVASLPLIPGQSVRLLGAEILAAGVSAWMAVLPLQRAYLHHIDPAHRPRSSQMAAFNRLAVGVIGLAGLVLVTRGDGVGFYLMAPGIFLSFIAAGANAWVLLIEINC